jgi:hypothetical protein
VIAEYVPNPEPEAELNRLLDRYGLGEELEPEERATLSRWVLQEILGSGSRRFGSMIVCGEFPQPDGKVKHCIELP